MNTVTTEVEKMAAVLETMGRTDAGVEDLVDFSEADRAALADALERLPDLDPSAGGATVKAPSIFTMTFWV